MSDTNYLISVGVPIGTFILGFVTSRFTMSKKERRDFQQTQYQNALNLAENQRRAYEAFTAALKQYVARNEPEFEDFVAIATTGDTYFYQLKLTGEAILSGKVDQYMRDETLIPMLVEATEKSIPAYYQALNTISQKKGFAYDGELKRSNYESIYGAVEKFA